MSDDKIDKAMERATISSFKQLLIQYQKESKQVRITLRRDWKKKQGIILSVKGGIVQMKTADGRMLYFRLGSIEGIDEVGEE